jgi:hypothetical protein
LADKGAIPEVTVGAAKPEVRNSQKLSTASHLLAGLTPPPSSLYQYHNRQQNRQLSNCLGVYIDVDIFRYSYQNKLNSRPQIDHMKLPVHPR